MATASQRALRSAEDGGAIIADSLTQQLAALRKQVDDISHSVQSYSEHSMGDLQHNAVAIADQARHQGQLVARQVRRQASTAGRAVHDNPVPVVVALGAIALLCALVFARD